MKCTVKFEFFMSQNKNKKIRKNKGDSTWTPMIKTLVLINFMLAFALGAQLFGDKFVQIVAEVVSLLF